MTPLVHSKSLTASRTADADDLRQPAQSHMTISPDLGSSSAPFVREFEQHAAA